MTVGFKYYQDEDRMVFDPSVIYVLPGGNIISPFIGDIEIGAKIHTEDCKRAISFFSQNFDYSRKNYTYLRILDKNGNFTWFQVEVTEDAGDGGLTGSIEELESSDERRSADEEAWFLQESYCFLEEIPIYDVPNLFLIKLTDYKSVAGYEGV